ncbi:NAD(P)-dependent dehydrogenase (short-subunit alcohol dehydrogenase family) [Pedobacter cryoconitis]|uniref:SDR family NAD(P)-dependent oxidoreductase n=1 Tax=Pedobacter cryoconitis TaxID=188932 RepID=UPI001608EA53|nr:SDR family NAD(P)-dependent oxidoreductase [Pedobacter cryoconitis]MBB6270817.1 NAD(P)-dependent dehydrogenase (short-subunit alcohol dehydrogenase family) [Pedobacter cryoconitis]
MKQLKNVLITGAAGGFGTVTIEALIAGGYTVTGAMRDVRSKNKQVAETLEKKGVSIVEIDVTSDESVVTGVNKALAYMGSMYIEVGFENLSHFSYAFKKQFCYPPTETPYPFCRKLIGLNSLILLKK